MAKYDEYGRRRCFVDVAGSAMPMQKIETVDMLRSEELASGQTTLGDLATTVKEDFRNRLIWGDSRSQCLAVHKPSSLINIYEKIF